MAHNFTSALSVGTLKHFVKPLNGPLHSRRLFTGHYNSNLFPSLEDPLALVVLYTLNIITVRRHFSREHHKAKLHESAPLARWITDLHCSRYTKKRDRLLKDHHRRRP